MIEDALKILQKGNLPKAEKLLTDTLKEQKENPEAYYYLAEICFQRDQFDKALDHIQKAISLKNDDYRYYELQGQSFAFKAQQSGAVKAALLIPKAKTALNKALELNPSALRAKEALFLIYMLAPAIAGGDEEKGKKILTEIEAQKNNHVQVLQAIIALNNKKNDIAETLLDEAVNSSKDDPEILKNSAQLYFELNKPSKALDALDLYLKIKPEDPVALFLQAECFNKSAKPEDAQVIYKKIAEIFPDSPAAKQAEKMLKK